MPYAVLAAALVALDQLVKYLVSHNIPLAVSYTHLTLPTTPYV